MSQGDSQGVEAEKYARKGKRKMNEDDAQASIPSPEPTARQRSNIQRLLNAAAPMRPLFFGSFVPDPVPAFAPMRPFSYGSFVPAPEPASAPMRPLLFGSFVPDLEPAFAPMRPFSSGSFVPAPEPASAPMRPLLFGHLSNSAILQAAEPPTIFFPSFLQPTTGQQIDQIIASNNQNLRNALYNTVEKQAEELAAKLIHDKEMETHAKIVENVKLDENLDHYKGQIARLLPHLNNWKKTVSHLQKKVREVKETYPNLDMGEVDTAESSHVNTGKIDPVRLNCVVCKKFVANIMMWTCRHVCVCSECDEVSRLCPVCGIPKISTVEVCIPTYD